MELKKRIEDYTEAEFIEFLNEFFSNVHNLKGRELESHIDSLVDHFDKIVDHPESNGLIFYPPDDREDSPQGIIEEIKRWRKSQGLPPFKDSD
ncbi:TPA: bacteriocin immunity protein [Citrobacter koseri]|uniref:bacteriocin immunity protein n=1 Tax=Citrobacter koseri TaxID=545 RepID=UPI001A2A04E9|nr:bacteriocin immunity protein [Citrobacter koseri]HDQ2603491.1 bacteriocin immunity protein [Citrobacter koseri]